MKITEVRTRVVQWEGETTPLPPHFCTNPMDLVSFREASMGNFAFHNWLLVEITRLAAEKPVEATIMFTNSVDRSTLLCSRAPATSRKASSIETRSTRGVKS